MCVKDGYVYQNVSMCMVERVEESYSAPAECVTGRWVTSIFSMTYYTLHRCMC